jgi:hypothetical protein
VSDSKCPVTRGEVDLSWYAERDTVWRELGLAAPARRALVDAGLRALYELSTKKTADISALHGIGKNALRTLAPYLAD